MLSKFSCRDGNTSSMYCIISGISPRLNGQRLACHPKRCKHRNENGQLPSYRRRRIQRLHEGIITADPPPSGSQFLATSPEAAAGHGSVIAINQIGRAHV